MRDRTVVVDELPILEIQAGLMHMGGDGDLYRRVLLEYERENQHTVEDLSRAIEEKRLADAAQTVHKVKSSSGSIGAKKIHELSVKLQKALDERQEEDINLLHGEFIQLFARLLSEISAYQAEQEPGRDGPRGDR